MDPDHFVTLTYRAKTQAAAKAIRAANPGYPADGEDVSDTRTVQFQLSLRRIPYTPFGLIIGCGVRADIKLPKEDGFKASHLAVGFDDHGNVTVKALRSGPGLRVTFNQDGDEKRSSFTWILHGTSFLEEIQVVTIHVAKSAFLSVVRSTSFSAADHPTLMSAFRLGCPGADLTYISRLLNKTWAGTNTKISPPGTGPIYLYRLLGSGGFGDVWRRYNVSDGSEVAVKKPISDRTVSEKNLEPWRKEFSLMQPLSHRNVLKLLSYQFLDGGPNRYIPEAVFEYCPGGALSTCAPLSLPEVLSVLRQCLSGLCYLHGQKIIHRDVKPDNILVKSRGSGTLSVVLGDFGLAHSGGRDPTSIVGTPRYAAPEVIGGSTTRYPRLSYDSAVDIWSLGVSMYEMGYGLPGPTAASWASTLLEDSADRADKDSEDLLLALLSRMLRLDPSERPDAHACLAQADDIQIDG